MTKFCITCKEDLPLDAFHKDKNGKLGLDKVCTPCKRWKYLFYVYKITKEQYTELMLAQDGRCGICSKLFLIDDKVCVDHDHRCCSARPYCGKCVRGLLCDSCNLGIGKLEDKISFMLDAIKYLERNECLY